MSDGRAVQQEDLFGEVGGGLAAEPVLMALHAEYYELVWRGLKRHRPSSRIPHWARRRPLTPREDLRDPA